VIVPGFVLWAWEARCVCAKKLSAGVAGKVVGGCWRCESANQARRRKPSRPTNPISAVEAGSGTIVNDASSTKTIPLLPAGPVNVWIA
jgi:hypothetical protein